MPVTLFQQPSSIKSSFNLFSAAIVVILLLTAGMMAYDDYLTHTENIDHTLEVEATRIDRNLLLEFEQASYLLESLARQILHLGANDKEAISRLLRAFDKKNTVLSDISWSDKSQYAVVSSSQGILPNPFNLSDRDYMKKTILSPWKIQTGRPINGRLTGKKILPLAIGVDDYEDNYVGTLLISINSEQLLASLKNKAEHSDLKIGLVTDRFLAVGESASSISFINNYFPTQTLHAFAEGNLTQENKAPPYFSSTQKNNLQTHIQRSANYPLLILVGLDPNDQWIKLLRTSFSHIFPLLILAVLLPFLIHSLKKRITTPIGELTQSATELLKAESPTIHTKGPSEVVELAKKFSKVSAYIGERRRIEHEQRAKTAQMKRAKEQAELSNRVKLDFMSSMSHELRIPLNNIIGFSEMMRNEAYGPIGNEQYLSYVQDIFHSAELLQSLINDVLALGKAEAEMLELQEKPLEVQFICTKCIRVLGDRLKEAGITIENRVPRDLPKLRVDELRLKQIILNLLINSISHTPSGGSIILNAEISMNKRDEPQFDLIITDFGAKRLPMQHQASLREQMDDDGRPKLRSRNHIGQLSNLGIPLTKALVAMHEATLEIQSPPGEATKVIVRFPAERLVY